MRLSYLSASLSCTTKTRFVSTDEMVIARCVPIGIARDAAIVIPSTGGRPLAVIPVPLVHSRQQQYAVYITLVII